MFLQQIYFFRKAMKQQWLPKIKFQQLQDKLLRSIIVHCFKNVPFYRSLWKKSKVNISSIRTTNDLKKLPIISKDDIVKNYSEFFASNYSQHTALVRETSGSLKKMRVFFDERCWDYMQAIYLRTLFSVGYNPHKPLAFFWADPPQVSFLNYFGLFKKIWIPASLSEEEQLDVLERENPPQIYYFSTSLFLLAQLMLKKGLKLSPELIITQADLLTNGMRNIIKKAFNEAPVLDTYGAQEIGYIGWECKESGSYHINSDLVYLELLDKNRENVSNGEEGSVILTHFANYLFPLIRYEIGDICVASDEQCSCGRSLPLVKSIEGRKKEVWDGRKICPKKLIDNLIYHGITKFKVKITNNCLYLLVPRGVELQKVRDACPFSNVRIKFTNPVKKTKRGKIFLVERI